MAVGGDDDTIAGSVPSLSGDQRDVPELVAGRYRVVRWLGGGGMGRVYEAIDTELDERVALKVLRAGLSDDALERFRREVRLTRRIQHRNVARMFDIGDHEGEKFLTMELIEGEPLTRELGRAMAWTRLSYLATQIGEGLAAAHRVGVVHRDLKPDNVLIERGTDRAVITDFGIARSVDDATVTQVGSIVGTPRYMAPEQLSGREVDARADLFSLGVMLYELASGDRPWSGDNAISIAVSQATQAAPPLRSSIAPPSFAGLIARCLELDPENRPATASEIVAAITTAPPNETATRAAKPSLPPPLAATGGRAASPAAVATAIAVMPLTCAPGDEYLADGVMEDLIDTLSSTESLRVRPAGLVRTHTAPDPRELGRQLTVDHVVAGSVRRTPTGLRVSARLIGVADGFQIWAHRADCAEAEVLSVSAELARAIAQALSARATAATRPTDPRAVDLYLRARAELRRFWGSHTQAAADLLEQAYELSPTSGPIAGALAAATVQSWVLQSEPALLDRVHTALERGLASGHPEAYLASAQYKFNTGDVEGGAADLGTAVIRAPMLAQAHEMAGKILVEIGGVSEARRHLETACALDPTRAGVCGLELARLDAIEGWWERADRQITTMIADSERALSQLAAVYQARLAGWRGDFDAMKRAAEQFAPRMGPHANKLIAFLASAGNAGPIDDHALRSFLVAFGGADRPERGKLMGLQLIAEIALLRGNDDAALTTLETADSMNLIDLVVLDKVPLFDRISNAPRFKKVRDSVARRALQVLAAYRSTAS